MRTDPLLSEYGTFRGCVIDVVHNSKIRSRIALLDGMGDDFADMGLPNSEGRYKLFCTNHRTVSGFRGEYPARAVMTRPWEWCEECRARAHQMGVPLSAGRESR